ncbi:hypothetical protein [Geomobilimonas luticola]|uniref:Uncharacterized protein n=1 Tax=Geomobilimonas luticola TaxID=1114878 RepID=A0ABS5S952_9BACT|nr:hypothetical protein [Geomobilimonas luticola]MBT0651903.1 hypothetical protein [Geomobilimonas luticola]
MTGHQLLKSQRNEVFLLIQGADLEPAAFQWETVNSLHESRLSVPRLVYVPSGDYFHFDLVKGKHWCQYSPGEDVLVESQYPGSWDYQLSYFSNNWLRNLKRELETPDMWTAIAGESALLLGTVVVEDETNSLFSPSEREHISRSLNEIRAYIESTHLVSEARVGFVEERLQYLEEAASRMGRKDWFNLAYGALINIVVGAALAPEAAKDLLRLAGTALAWVLGGQPALLAPGR